MGGCMEQTGTKSLWGVRFSHRPHNQPQEDCPIGTIVKWHNLGANASGFLFRFY